MATIIENLKKKISQGAVVGSPFNLRGVAPNFNRDRIDSLEELGAVTKDDNIYDIGHLVYCVENENIYIFRGHTGGTNYIGQFELFGSGSGSGNGALFEYKGNISGLTQADNEGAVEGWVYRVNAEVIVIPALNSATGQEVSAHTGDVIVCVDKNTSTSQLTWSIIENTLDQAGLVKKDDNASYHEGDIAVYSNSSGDKIKSTGIKAEDIASVEKNYVTDSTARGTQLYGNTPNTNVPILNDKGNLVDSQVSIDVLRKLQKELGGTEIVETPNDPVKGTLADIIKSYRDNNYKLGSSYDTISATTEEQFISDIQGIFSANTNEVGFILPIVALKNENAQTEEDKYIFEDYIPASKSQINVEAVVRKDGVDNNDNICFHIHFLTQKWTIDYWYQGSEEESLLYFEAFGDDGGNNNVSSTNENSSLPSNNQSVIPSLIGTYEGAINLYYSVRQVENTEIAFGDGGVGYWIDYYSNEPNDYSGYRINYEIRNSRIYITFRQTQTTIEICDYHLTNNHFTGSIIEGTNTYTDFDLIKTSDNVNLGDYDYD